MFGDTFGTQSDYVKGMEDQMRRAYMGDDPGEVVSTTPDTMFLSRDQGKEVWGVGVCGGGGRAGGWSRSVFLG